jgi:hypothetical protein
MPDGIAPAARSRATEGESSSTITCSGATNPQLFGMPGRRDVLLDDARNPVKRRRGVLALSASPLVGLVGLSHRLRKRSRTTALPEDASPYPRLCG